ncbi:hypothetical protein AVEN_39415-1 [Araneus ventricosus]|uniref:Uncharacterized protein n=1 Tax=Araneus ventricosus TaxID=182803 RepID=A0A4Y1ZSL5_ARAVE|nr:hypothetical protein AVEN_39415-1 [Araneus ventricosus]
MITGDDGARCNLETETLFNFFSGAWGPASSDPSFYEETQETRTGVLDRDFSVAEVVKKLRNADNSAAGPDRLTYHHWRTVDPAGKTLTKIFNLCLLFRRIPPSWKETKTILIPKKNVDLALPANWRPIALSNTIYKLFTKCITGRLTSWCESTPENSTQHTVLAFADDLALLANSPQELQTNLDRIYSDLARISLRVNPSKSVALHIGGSVPVGARETSFSIGGTPLTVLTEFDRHRFLGKPVGFSVLPDYASLETMVLKGNKLIESALAPWQIMEALKKFYFASLQFAMRTAQFGKSDWNEVDRQIRPGIKSTLSLPENAANEFLYGSRSLGCWGVPIAAEEFDLNIIDTAFKLLTSPDESVAAHALEQLKDSARHRFREEPTDEILST